MREQLSRTQHEFWSSWLGWMIGICEENEDGSLTIPAHLVERWKQQIATDYDDLSDYEKGANEEQADKIMEIIWL